MKNLSFASVVAVAIAASSATGVAVATSSCTPAEQQAVEKGIENAATCIEGNAVPGADPVAVATKCGLNAIPDVISIINSSIMAKTAAKKQIENCTVIMVDAGAPDGKGK